MAAVVTIGKKQNQSRCLRDEQAKNMNFMYHESIAFAGKWMPLETIIFSKKDQTQTNQVISLICIF